jgi:hypothetical protein
MTLLLLVNLGGAGGTATTQPVVFGDLTTLFVGYVQDLRDAGTALDVDTEVAADLATVRTAASAYLDDANTMYAAYLS